MQKTWVLNDDRPGNNNQAIGVAEALGQPFEIKNIVYNNFAKLPNWILGASLASIKKSSSSHITPPLISSWPDMLISAGRRMAPIARYIKKQNPETYLVHLMWPGYPCDEIDLIATPEHDSYKMPPGAKNVMFTYGAPNRINNKLLETEAKKWNPAFSQYKKPRIALLIGGSLKKNGYNKNIISRFADNLLHLAKSKNASIIGTTSRRTEPGAVALLKQHLGEALYLYEWGKDAKNPYFALLGLADYIVATGDSISMCSESCSTGKPVFIFAPDEIMSQKHKQFAEQLFLEKYAFPFAKENFEAIKNYKPKTLDVAVQIAGVVRERFANSNKLV